MFIDPISVFGFRFSELNMRKNILFFGLFFFGAFFCSAQGLTIENYLQKRNPINKLIVPPTLNKSKNPETSNVQRPPSTVLIKPFDKKDLPFFCRIEYDMIKQKNIPVKFRLGDVQYVDQLEGKGH